MYAAVVREFDKPPRYEDFTDAIPIGPHDVTVDVLASGLHPRVRSQANGSHYTSTADLPLIPGIDGVGRLPDGKLVYFVLPDTQYGAMAEKAVVDLRRTVELPDDVDPVVIAAAMNPAMSSWVALRRRIQLEPGQSVLVLGATGNAGQLAVQIAKHFGAGQVIGVGRGESKLAVLPALGADVVVSLEGEPEAVAARLGEVASEVDVVIDYLWGQPARQTMLALVPTREDSAKRLAWIQIGSVAGPEVALPSAALRAANLQLMGSGQGSVTTAGILAELPVLATEISKGTFSIDAVAVGLAEVEHVWTTPAEGNQRVVITP